MKVLVTGCCGFIGSYVTLNLLKNDYQVIGVDIMNDYYDINIKEINKNILSEYENFYFYKEDVIDSDIIERVKPDKVCHLASMAGVRYSIENPILYVKNNIEAFVNLLDQSVKNNVKNFVYASSSSVYGLNEKVPFCESDDVNSCNSPYAASKRSMEIFANTYNQLYSLPLIGLRFFTVYGPRGRPDMAPYKFLDSILNDKKFKKYGDGNSLRDYTYIDDIVDGIISALDNKNNLCCEIFNLGNSKPVSLNSFIECCEEVTGKKAKYDIIENQLGDVPLTYADIEKSRELLNYCPKVSLREGLDRTCKWMISEGNKYNTKNVNDTKIILIKN
tara:strand:- start:3701 stop:4696 length:996 start_codon:yes stop_codon:yes gene_type:complete